MSSVHCLPIMLSHHYALSSACSINAKFFSTVNRMRRNVSERFKFMMAYSILYSGYDQCSVLWYLFACWPPNYLKCWSMQTHSTVYLPSHNRVPSVTQGGLITWYYNCSNSPWINARLHVMTPFWNSLFPLLVQETLFFYDTWMGLQKCMCFSFFMTPQNTIQISENKGRSWKQLSCDWSCTICR